MTVRYDTQTMPNHVVDMFFKEMVARECKDVFATGQKILDVYEGWPNDYQKRSK